MHGDRTDASFDMIIQAVSAMQALTDVPVVLGKLIRFCTLPYRETERYNQAVTWQYVFGFPLVQVA
jgi:hypothetical protein